MGQYVNVRLWEEIKESNSLFRACDYSISLLLLEQFLFFDSTSKILGQKMERRNLIILLFFFTWKILFQLKWENSNNKNDFISKIH